MDSRYSYDEDQQVWPFFAVTVLGCVLIPATISQIMTLIGGSATAPPKGYSAKLAQYDSQKRRSYKGPLLVAVGWLLMGVLFNVIRSIEASTAADAFDPWQLLGIASAATEKEVKAAYRKLTLKYHPDKVRDLGELTLEEVEDRFVTITKAYKALTDEVTRENFLKYGHPDGPQSEMMGIALPKFLVEGGTPIIATIYLLIGIGAPLLAARWWRIQSRKNRQGILQTSATKFVLTCAQEQAQFISSSDILELLAECEDFEDSKTPAERVEAFKAHFENPASSDPATVVVAVKLLQGLHSIAFEFKNFEFCRRVTELERCFVVGVDPKNVAGAEKSQQPVGQTPYNIPKIRVLKAFFRVPGMEVVPAGSTPHLVIRYLVVPPNATKIPDIDDEVLEDLTDPTVDEIKVARNPLYTNTLSPKMPPTQSLYYPHSEGLIPHWNAYIYGDMERILSAPVVLDHIDLSNLSLTPEQFASGDGVVISTFKIQLAAPIPNQLAKIPLKLALLNTGYFGVDVRQLVVCETLPIPEVGIIEEDDEEDEEVDPQDEESDLSDIDTDTEDESEN